MSVTIIDGDGGDQDAKLASRLADDVEPGDEVIVLRRGGATAGVFTRLLSGLWPAARERLAERAERRIEALVDLYADAHTFAAVEAEIDQDNAKLRARFLAEIPCLTSAEVHRAAGRSGANAAQTANAWKKAGRVLGIPHQGRDVFPRFQFDADGRPRPLMAEALAALPADMTPWQRAFWMAAGNGRLGGRAPREAIETGDRAVVEAARAAGDPPVG